MYRLIISPQAQKQLKSIKQTHHQAVKLALEDIKDDPTIGKQLTRELTGKFSYRVSVYRIIYKIDKKEKLAYILVADHRAVVYR